MHYQIRSIEIPVKTCEIITFEADLLCKLLECYISDDKLYIDVMERWGSVRTHTKQHSLLLLKAGDLFELNRPFDAPLSRRGSIIINGEKHYVFQV